IPSCGVPLFLDVAPSALTHLSLASSRYSHFIPMIVRAVGHQLERLDFKSRKLGFEEQEMREHLSLLVQHATGLEHLTMRCSMRAMGPSLLDHVHRYLPYLKHLHCGSWTFSGALFDNMPHPMHSLRLEARNTGTKFPLADTVRFVERVERGERELDALTILMVHMPQYQNHVPRMQDETCKYIRLSRSRVPRVEVQELGPWVQQLVDSTDKWTKAAFS
ncbi:hypothetical protein OBBRIDRAFT_845465, partial [Obba rivulosa]